MSARRTGLAIVDAAVGAAAPLPRDNGELVFEEPWQGRALGMGVVSLERAGAELDLRGRPRVMMPVVVMLMCVAHAGSR